ncbi:MAG: hypothetical protein WBN18_03010 [Flavobacteriaceae bacterium]
MENSRLGGRILKEVESLISKSIPAQNAPEKLKSLHETLIMKHYNATDVTIDYHRRRIKMNIVTDDSAYDPNKVNTELPTLPTNLWYRNLYEFLVSCIDKDQRSIAFYSQMIRGFQVEDHILSP